MRALPPAVLAVCLVVLPAVPAAAETPGPATVAGPGICIRLDGLVRIRIRIGDAHCDPPRPKPCPPKPPKPPTPPESPKPPEPSKPPKPSPPPEPSPTPEPSPEPTSPPPAAPPSPALPPIRPDGPRAAGARPVVPQPIPPPPEVAPRPPFRQAARAPQVPERRRNPMGTVTVIAVLAVVIASGTVLVFAR